MILTDLLLQAGNLITYVMRYREECSVGMENIRKRCSQWMMDKFHVNHVMLTTSCTHALEMAAHLCDIKPGDEVIMPSYTFVSTADAFVLKGAKIVFVDIRPDTMNIDEKLIEAAVTEKTKVIVPVTMQGLPVRWIPLWRLQKNTI